ncbi:unnamed protein product [Rotaria sp. Silwood1]|nr:unnamed protein product [Rotaria sp. Silwood1]CAF1183469.1 unnamed protein product [Rotaria sp. Silwood1]CAF3452629.1 unnamed protein product [Rotaria sp. Silwood1]CAF3481379.1 unnamed protein product [Rotaria sp. Silwood1]CAF3497387.1 unnamed protein product [Rotaria sp. Silwood1]
MIKSYCPHLFLLIICFILVLLFTIINCNHNDDTMETTLFKKRLTTKTTKNHLYDLLEQANLNDEEINIFIQDLLQPYPNRRSSFYAMRGKRQSTLP